MLKKTLSAFGAAALVTSAALFSFGIPDLSAAERKPPRPGSPEPERKCCGPFSCREDAEDCRDRMEEKGWECTEPVKRNGKWWFEGTRRR